MASFICWWGHLDCAMQEDSNAMYFLKGGQGGGGNAHGPALVQGVFRECAEGIGNCLGKLAK